MARQVNFRHCFTLSISLVLAITALGCSNTAPTSLQPTKLELAQSFQPHPTYTLAPTAGPGRIRFVAVGDCYTCGTNVAPGQDWPSLLVEDLNAHNLRVGLAANAAVESNTTSDALNNEVTPFKAARPQFASLMIGMNDTFTPTPVPMFRSNLKSLIDKLQNALPNRKNLFLITIPDYTGTPLGSSIATQNDAVNKISLFNTIIEQEGKSRGLPVIDITPLSRKLVWDSSMISYDDIHPSASQYVQWEKLIYPVAAKMAKSCR